MQFERSAVAPSPTQTPVEVLETFWRRKKMEAENSAFRTGVISGAAVCAALACGVWAINITLHHLIGTI